MLHVHGEFDTNDMQEWLNYWFDILLTAHLRKVRKTEQEALDKLRVAQRQFLLDSGWTDRGNGWWMPPHRLYPGGFHKPYLFDHAINSMQWVLRHRCGIV